ncbi:C-type lectin domain-containing protein [Synechococcus sp. CBW1006]|uniref:C-type lectin domain-containing protein n=1 Tax=Synechococcus sp. CBW1006 TaxID=1353138 RepID=UPI0018CDEBB2|nr:C-type lectin domain-containing protein [Synechococcus sp. CBW1006]QPN66536.1 hypothetical protein H8F26_17735 [Synechococcus sp. CBW1006]
MTSADTSTELLTDLLPEWHEMLVAWASDGRLTAAAQEALLVPGDAQEFTKLVSQWSAADFHSLPSIGLLSSADIHGAKAAYAQATGQIYLNADWLVTASKAQVFAVLTEELGHHLDGLLNAEDTAGDEGEMFSRLLAGEILGDGQKAALRTQNDSGSATINLINVPVENAAVSLIRANSLYTIVQGPTWTQAEANAVALGGHLATVGDANENQFLQDNFSYPDPAPGSVGLERNQTRPSHWIGATDATIEGTWVWSSGESFNSTNWLTGQPDNSTFFSGTGQDYAVMTYLSSDSVSTDNGKWDDLAESERNIDGIAEIPLVFSIDLPVAPKEGAQGCLATCSDQPSMGNWSLMAI